MNFFKQIQLINYRNFINYSVNLNNNCNVIVGPNGSGKTNILESISLFERGRGFRKEKINNLINNKSPNKIFKIKSKFVHNENEIDLAITNNIYGNKFKKKLSINESDSIESIEYFENLFSIIYFLPEMERLFVNSPSLRRNFLDRLIYGVDRNYLKIINKYQKKILERSNILKQKKYDLDWIKQIEIEIVDLGVNIFKKRDQHLKILNSILSSLKKINNKFYQVHLKVSDNFITNIESSSEEIKSLYLLELEQSRNFDSIVGGCKIGPHKTDIYGINQFNKLNINQFSTGQQKTVVLLIIIAQCKYLLEILKRKPIILFDEICSHLDEDNRSLMLKLIDSLNVQILLTGTEKSLFSFLSTKATYCNISDQ